MAKRHKLTKKGSRRLFSATAGQHRRNYAIGSRGGIRA